MAYKDQIFLRPLYIPWSLSSHCEFRPASPSWFQLLALKYLDEFTSEYLLTIWILFSSGAMRNFCLSSAFSIPSLHRCPVFQDSSVHLPGAKLVRPLPLVPGVQVNPAIVSRCLLCPGSVLTMRWNPWSPFNYCMVSSICIKLLWNALYFQLVTSSQNDVLKSWWNIFLEETELGEMMV